MINIGWGKNISIKELAESIRQVIDYFGGTLVDVEKPDGALEKLMVSSCLTSLGMTSVTSLHARLNLIYDDFLTSNSFQP